MYSQSFSSVQKDDALTVRDHWFLYFKGMIYKHKSTEAIMKSQKNFRIKKKKTWKLSTTIAGVFPTTVALLQEV